MRGEPEFLTVPELATLLRIKERKVYDLAASGTIPCTRATGKLLFPESDIRAWIATNQSGVRKQRPAVFLGSHDPLLEWALRQSQCGLATYFDGSGDGLDRFEAGDGVATGLHIFDGSSNSWNLEAVGQRFRNRNVVLLGWAERGRGLIVPKMHADDATSMAWLNGKSVAVRQPTSGTSALFSGLAKDVSYSPIGPFHSEQDAALAVAEGSADAAFGLKTMAKQFGLGFVPLVTERFDILVDRAAYFSEPFQKLLAFCGTPEFSRRVATLEGYAVEDLGKVRWSA